MFLISKQNEKDKSVRCPTAAALQPKLAWTTWNAIVSIPGQGGKITALLSLL